MSNDEREIRRRLRAFEHAYIKPRTLQLNGKVEPSHRTDEQEFYQLLTYKDDVDLQAPGAVVGPHPGPRGGSWVSRARGRVR